MKYCIIFILEIANHLDHRLKGNYVWDSRTTTTYIYICSDIDLVVFKAIKFGTIQCTYLKMPRKLKRTALKRNRLKFGTLGYLQYILGSVGLVAFT